MWTDIRHAIRALAQSRSVLAMSVLCLGLGIGVVTMVFAVVNGVLLRPVPFLDPAGLLQIAEVAPPGGTANAVSLRSFSTWRRQPLPYDLAAVLPTTVTTTRQGDSARLATLAATWNSLSLLGVDPIAGRSFRPGEDQPGAEAVVLIGEGLWRTAFGADAAVIGTRIGVDGRDATVIGVVPVLAHPGLPGAWRTAQIWVPLATIGDASGDRTLTVLARAPRGEDPLQVAAALASRLTAINVADPARRDRTVTIAPLDLSVSPTTRAMLLTSTGASIVVLLIGCVNVANLLLLRSTSRQREMATRLALGASRGRIVRQLIVESALLALASVPPGVFLGWLGRTWLLAGGPEPAGAMLPVDARVVAAATGAALLTSVLFGLAPAVQVRRWSTRGMLGDGGRHATPGRSPHRLRLAFATSEIVLSVVLVASASLLGRSFVQMLDADRDLDLDQIVVVGLGSPEERQESPEETARATGEIHARVGVLPGVRSAALAEFMPLRGAGPRVEARRGEDDPDAPALVARESRVSAGFFEAVGIAFDGGRPFSAAEVRAGEPVVVLNQRLANLLWGGQDAVGRRVRLGGEGAGTPRVHTVVGVSRNISNWDVSGRPLPSAYLPLAAVPTGRRVLVARTSGDPAAVISTVRGVVASFDRRPRGLEPLPLGAVSRDAFFRQQTLATLFGVFGVLSILLTVVGLYGVLSYFVSQRRRELGIRAALGARPRDLAWLVARQMLVVAGSGIAIGTLVAAGATRALQSVLFEVSATDPISFGITAALLAAVCGLAGWPSAHRASAADPAVSLRE